MSLTGYQFASPPKPFAISFPDEEVADIKRRLKNARFPAADLHADHDVDENGPPDLYGTSGPPLSWMKKFTKLWLEDFDWKKAEAGLNRYPQFKVDIDGLSVHFVHQRSTVKNAIPLMLVHGWPGSFAEFLDCVDNLTAPHNDGPSFHVVIPSQPGFIFSQAPRTKHWDMNRTAEQFDKLMQGLGYGDGYAVQAGDWGSIAARCMASRYPQRCKAVHLNFCPALPPGPLKYIPPSNFTIRIMPRFLITDLERERLFKTVRYLEKGSGYYLLQSTTPGTVAFGLNDSPLATLAWIGEKYLSWVTQGSGLTPDAIFQTCTLYYLTDTLGSGMLPYRDNPHFSTFLVDSKYYIKVPMAVSIFPEEIAISPKSWVARTGNLQWYKENKRGGHFIALEYPDDLCSHLRDAFGKIWPDKRSARL